MIESTEEYAQRRANETGRAYIVSSYGHAMLDCSMNRACFRDIGETVAARFTKQPA